RWFRAGFWLAVVGLLVLALLVTRAGDRWPSLFYMTGPSMEPSVMAHEYFLAWSPPDRIERGDLVIFRFEYEGTVYHVLRRVAGLPGDTVAMDSGVVILNGEPQRWQFRIVTPAVYRSELAIEGVLFDFGPWIVPPDSVVLLADTRDMDGWPDSRFLGFIPKCDIEARADFTLSGRRLP
ncbi:MAG: signal peptidase I, partial [Gemmatimonadota bacterium]